MSAISTTPLTEILELYRSMHPHALSRSEVWARRFAADPAELVGVFLSSVEYFSRYSNPEQAFHGKLPAFQSRHGKTLSRTIDLVCRLAQSGLCAVDGSPTTFTYLDRELDCMRTAPGQPLEDGTKSKRAIVLDLLLRHDDGTPILAEVKIREDADAFFALVQTLTAAAHLVTPAQLRRLSIQYDALALDRRAPRVDLLVLLFPETPRTGKRVPLLAGSKQVAASLLRVPEVARLVRTIEFVDAHVERGRFAFTRA